MCVCVRESVRFWLVALISVLCADFGLLLRWPLPSIDQTDTSFFTSFQLLYYRPTPYVGPPPFTLSFSVSSSLFLSPHIIPLHVHACVCVFVCVILMNEMLWFVSSVTGELVIWCMHVGMMVSADPRNTLAKLDGFKIVKVVKVLKILKFNNVCLTFSIWLLYVYYLRLVKKWCIFLCKTLLHL